MSLRRRVGAATVCVLVLLSAGAITSSAQESRSDAPPTLDYLYYKERVQPIFLSRAAGRARCVACHVSETPRLEEIPSGSTTWTDDQSRRHFEVWKTLVVPGRPMESLLLRHPLAREAGGTAFHGGGKPWASPADAEWQTIAGWIRGRRLGGLALPTLRDADLVLQTNAAGDGVLVIDPGRREVVGLVSGIEAPDGIDIAPDGRRVYVANRGRRTLDVVDARTLEVFKRIELSGVPSGVEAAPDGDRVYVGIRSTPGAVDVIDARALTVAKRIPVDGAVGSVRLTPDGTHLFAATPETPRLQGIDVISHDAVTWTVALEGGVHAMDFIERGDGSTRYVLAQLSGRAGVSIVDFGIRQVIEQIGATDDEPEGDPSTGLTLDHEGQTLWIAGAGGTLLAYGVPGRCRPGQPQPGERCAWETLSSVDVGGRPSWLTMTSDGETLIVSLAGENVAVLVDPASAVVRGTVATGHGPGRSVAGGLTVR